MMNLLERPVNMEENDTNTSHHFSVGELVQIIADPACGNVYGKGITFNNYAGKIGCITKICPSYGIATVCVDNLNLDFNIHCLKFVARNVESYYMVVSAGKNSYNIRNTRTGKVVCNYNQAHPNSQEAAKLECERLNNLAKENK